MSASEAKAVIKAGADALGFHVGEVQGSRSIISASNAKRIISALPKNILSVLVTTGTDAGAIIEMAREIGASAIQCHGDITPKNIEWMKKELAGVKIFKTVHVEDGLAVEDAKLYASIADGILLDSSSKDRQRIGGTGETHDWAISAKIVRAIRIPVILAGGLNPGNIAAAIAEVRPDMVDVNSGVSNPDGAKDMKRVRAFIKAAKQT